MENKEFYIMHDGLKLHAKLEFPEADPNTDTNAERFPLLILEHGFTGHMEERHILAVARAALRAGYACLRIELYGHGSSDGSFRDHTVPKWVSEMLTVIDHAAALPFADGIYLAGHSQGGLTAILAAAHKRDVIRGLIPLSPALMIRDHARKGISFGLSFDPEHVPEELAIPGGRILDGNYFRTAMFLPVREALEAYKGPVLIIHADTDETVPVSCALKAAGIFENAELVIIEGDTHCYDRRLEDVTEAVEEFLRRMRKEE